MVGKLAKVLGLLLRVVIAAIHLQGTIAVLHLLVIIYLLRPMVRLQGIPQTQVMDIVRAGILDMNITLHPPMPHRLTLLLTAILMQDPQEVLLHPRQWDRLLRRDMSTCNFACPIIVI